MNNESKYITIDAYKADKKQTKKESERETDRQRKEGACIIRPSGLL